MADVKFGTSGLRGLVQDLTDALCRRYAGAFLRHMAAQGGLRPGGAVLIGRDLRASSPRLAAAVSAEIMAQGYQTVNCGQLPTPALALAALSRQAPAVMITGSHIPDDRNGLKFYRPDGEIDKQDEAAIVKLAAKAAAAGASLPAVSAAMPAEDNAARRAYLQRWAEFLPQGSLSGLRIGVYQHSTVARDILAEIVSALGAEAVPLHRSEKFVPVDTEALRNADKEIARAAAKSGLDALISADGDGDRPLVADEKGEFIYGDILGILTACFLRADTVITPLTSTAALELSGFFPHIIRCRVGSPFVLAAMRQAAAAGNSKASLSPAAMPAQSAAWHKADERQNQHRILGFEANGGVLLGSDIGGLKALPTRDAVLPILSVLALARQRQCRLSALRGLLPPWATAADRLQNYPPAAAERLFAALRAPHGAQNLLPALGAPAETDETDGTRLIYANKEIVHFRASGNAPELRCYAQAASEERAQALLNAALGSARACLAPSFSVK